MGEKTETEIGILHPSDSKRVAEALLAKIEDADFDIAWSMGYELENALSKGLTCGLGDAILSQIELTLRNVVGGCLCSREMHRTIGDAIREGVEDR